VLSNLCPAGHRLDTAPVAAGVISLTCQRQRGRAESHTLALANASIRTDQRLHWGARCCDRSWPVTATPPRRPNGRSLKLTFGCKPSGAARGRSATFECGDRNPGPQDHTSVCSAIPSASSTSIATVECIDQRSRRGGSCPPPPGASGGHPGARWSIADQAGTSPQRPPRPPHRLVGPVASTRDNLARPRRVAFEFVSAGPADRPNGSDQAVTVRPRPMDAK